MNAIRTELDPSDPISRLRVCPRCERDVFVIDGNALFELPRGSIERAEVNGVYDFAYDACVSVYATQLHQCGAKKR